jgi:hypothetical protein
MTRRKDVTDCRRPSEPQGGRRPAGRCGIAALFRGLGISPSRFTPNIANLWFRSA